MSQPTPFVRAFNFAQYAQQNPSAPYAPAGLDTELDHVQTTCQQMLANLALIQRDDGGLANGIVTVNTLDQATKNLMGAWNPRGVWVASGTSYAVRDMVTPTGGTVTYVCAIAHSSSSTFAADLALGRWQPVNGVGSAAITAPSITFSTTDRLLGRATAGAGAGEEIVCTSVARSLLAAATASDQRNTIGLGSGSSPTFVAITASFITLSAASASAFLYSDAAKAIASTPAAINGQLLIGSTGSVPVPGTLTGTANQVVVTNGAGSITLSLPQSIGAGSTPTFTGLQLSSLVQGGVVFAGASSQLSSDAATFFWDNTNKRLGINRPIPHANIDVLGTVYAGSFFLADSTGYEAYNSFITQRGAPFNGSALSAGGAGESGWNALGFWIGSLGLNFASESNFTAGATLLTSLIGDAANVLAQRNGVTGQVFRIYNTYSGAGANYERCSLGWAGNVMNITMTAAGTGTPRALAIGATSANVTLSTTTSGDIVLNPAGDIRWGKALVALGGGAAPTLGTIGGAGPTAAAQNSWVRALDSTGAAVWIPAWK